MDAVEFIKERNRMCKSFGGSCNGCPADENICCDTFEWNEKMVAIVEEWSMVHPLETRQSVFLKQWPTAKIDENGCLDVCPYLLSDTYRNKYGNCGNYGVECSECLKNFWTNEAE